MSQPPSAVNATLARGRPAGLVFDVFGTVVDWHGSVVRELVRIGLPVDPPAFAQAWRAGYAPAMDEVRRGDLPWTNIDGLHRRILDGLLDAAALTLNDPARQALNLVWHRLDPWPDSARGLARLRALGPTATLSNGHLALLVDLARHGDLRFDAILSAELFGHYKPDPQTYLGAARLLGLQPGELMMVAAHPADLRAAADCGLRTALVQRPHENGPNGTIAPWQAGEFELVAKDFNDLALQLGC